MHSSISGQTRTPSHLKWLLNERAMLLGEVQRREKRVLQLSAEAEKLRIRISALDFAMALFDARVDPQAGGSVKATSERYGGRGGLTQFLKDQVIEAGHEGVDTVTLTIRAAARFNVTIASIRDRNTYRDTVGWTLRYLRRKGLIENGTVSRGGHTPSTWRAKRPPSLRDLHALAQACELLPNG